MASRRSRTGWMSVAVTALLCAACGAAGVPAATQTGGSPGRDRDAVCERYMQVLSKHGSITSSEDSTGRTSPPQAVQHLRSARALLKFGRWASTAADAAVAASAEGIEREAADVLTTLRPTDSNARSQEVTATLYEQTAKLYYDCSAELYREALEGDRPLNGACAEPGAPKLEGPNVIVYGSSMSFIDSTCELVQGTRSGDGCGSSAGWSSGPADTGSHGSEEVAYDPDTCRSLVESGRLAPDR